MKLSIPIFFLLSFFCVKSQTQINKTFESGIYTNFSDFKNNKPSIKLIGEIKPDDYKYGNLLDKKVMTYYFLKISKEESKKIGEIFGFSDGVNFYISAYPHSIYDYEFYILESIGEKFMYFESLKSSQYGEMHIQNTLNMDTGEINYLTNGRVKKILKDKPEIYEKFINQTDKPKYWKEYLIEYLKK